MSIVFCFFVFFSGAQISTALIQKIFNDFRGPKQSHLNYLHQLKAEEHLEKKRIALILYPGITRLFCQLNP